MTDVHTEHCCLKHGCKYGEDESCTVVQKIEKQSYPCEECSYEEERMEDHGEVWQYGVVSDYGVEGLESNFGGAIDALLPGKPAPDYLKKGIKVVRRRVSKWEEVAS